ncbi:MAG: TatD family hydrolase [Alphaproteobacteria bacterium]
MITFNKCSELREIFADLPLDRLLVETDSPFLAPIPMRGRRNEPAFVRHTAENWPSCATCRWKRLLR